MAAAARVNTIIKNMKTILIIGVAVVVLLVGGSLLSHSLQSGDPDVISQSGVHWHPRLEIFVKGERIDVPANIGIGPQYAGMPTFDTGMRMTAVHTHEDLPIIHLEFPALVRKSDVMLGHFFRIWGKDMRSFGTNVRMTVNGEESTEFENYVMRDGDKIELRFEELAPESKERPRCS